MYGRVVIWNNDLLSVIITCAIIEHFQTGTEDASVQAATNVIRRRSGVLWLWRRDVIVNTYVLTYLLTSRFCCVTAIVTMLNTYWRSCLHECVWCAQFDKIFEPYTKYCLEQDICREYIKTKTMENELFRTFVTVSITPCEFRFLISHFFELCSTKHLFCCAFYVKAYIIVFASSTVIYRSSCDTQRLMFFLIPVNHCR